MVKVIADALNVRSENRVNERNVIGIVYKGDELEVIKQGPKWTEIKYKDKKAYVMNESRPLDLDFFSSLMCVGLYAFVFLYRVSKKSWSCSRWCSRI